MGNSQTIWIVQARVHYIAMFEQTIWDNIEKFVIMVEASKHIFNPVTEYSLMTR